MTLPTLVVCDAGEEKKTQLQALIGANPSLALVGTSTMHETFDKILQLSPRLIWIELTPDPDEGIKLLVGLKEKYPTVHCLVSNEDLDADLVKMTMQMGAVDFLDAKTWNDQLPDVIKRIVIKEKAQEAAREKLEADRERMREVMEAQKAALPNVSKTNLRAMKKMRTDSSEIQSRATTNLILIVVVVIILGGILFALKPGAPVTTPAATDSTPAAPATPATPQ